jgi:GT2 family glycosyltransferase/intein/homing endonuclease
LGADKKKINVPKYARIVLSEWFIKYVPKFLRIIKYLGEKQAVPSQKQQKPSKRIIIKPLMQPQLRKLNISRPQSPRRNRVIGRTTRRRDLVVGHKASGDPAAVYQAAISHNDYPISNNIGIGILSYNRLDCLSRLLGSIRKYTDTAATTIFISDESSSSSPVKEWLKQQKDVIVIDNDTRLGVAGNSNRLLRCLSRFRYKIILNDDVEIISDGWERFYFDAMAKSKFHHFCFRQPGVYGAKNSDGTTFVHNGVAIKTIDDKPHGSILAFDDKAFKTVGFFDEQFGLYGMEHVDWSRRISLSGIQPVGYHDVIGSDKYFKILREQSAVEDRTVHLKKSREIFDQLISINERRYVHPSKMTAVPRVSYVIPFRNLNVRSDSITTVIANIKAQKFPDIEIIVVEHDSTIGFRNNDSHPIEHIFVESINDKQLFNKSLAFNTGVSKTNTQHLILHDADIIIPAWYTSKIYQTLLHNDSCHFGKQVLYLTKQSTGEINHKKKVAKDKCCDRVVDYFEGGSLGIRKSAYIDIGGFDEKFEGYGCFAPGNKVLTKDGYKNIENVSNELLYTHAGEWRMAEPKKRLYNGEIFDIYVPGRLPIKGITPEHPLLVKNQDTWIWKEAKDIKIGDEILSTDYIPDCEPDWVKTLSEFVIKDKSKNKFDIIENLDDLSYLIGLYLADGVIQTPKKLCTTYLFLHESDDNNLVDYVNKIVRKLNSNINVSTHYVKNGCRDVRIFNSLLAKFIKSIAGKRQAKGKLLSTSFVKHLTDANIAHLLGGIADGDAGRNSGSENRIVYHTSSINLAMLISAMLRRLNIAHSFGKRRSHDSEAYDITVNREFEHKIRMIHGAYKKYVGSNSVGKTKFGKVYKMISRHYIGPVYNFEVDEDHSYIVNGLVVHNCEDCEFYERMKSKPKFVEDRTISMVHLWHDRTAGWEIRHKINRDYLNKIQSSHTIDERCVELRNLLIKRHAIK